MLTPPLNMPTGASLASANPAFASEHYALWAKNIFANIHYSVDGKISIRDGRDSSGFFTTADKTIVIVASAVNDEA